MLFLIESMDLSVLRPTLERSSLEEIMNIIHLVRVMLLPLFGGSRLLLASQFHSLSPPFPLQPFQGIFRQQPKIPASYGTVERVVKLRGSFIIMDTCKDLK